ncbi:hypothetical protein [Nocardioides sp. NPDC006303]|uniref:hypothetical protein n=1 Tax=Nocardioides sp. NPDC006303 TaxID=3156747 RepID=UPI0033BD1F0F
MIVLAAESTAGPNLGGFLVVIIIVGLFWLIQDVSKKARARSEHLRARRSLTSSQRRAVAKINRSAKAYNGSTKRLWDQFGAFKGNPKAFGKDAAALHRKYKDSKKK